MQLHSGWLGIALLGTLHLPAGYQPFGAEKKEGFSLQMTEYLSMVFMVTLDPPGSSEYEFLCYFIQR